MRRRIDECIAAGKSFAVETTLAGNNHFRTIATCKAAGMRLAMYYIFVRDIHLAKGRVSTRVAAGGHDVPETDQERRFDRSIANALIVVRLVNEAYFYDNSVLGGHRLVAEFVDGKPVAVAPDAPAWLRGAARL